MSTNATRQFFSGAMVIGTLQVFDGLSYLFGVSGEINIAYSYIELLWFVASLVFVFILHITGRRIIVPVMYMSYITLNVWLASQFFESSPTPPGYIIPVWFCWITIVLGLAIIVAALREYRLTKNE